MRGRRIVILLLWAGTVVGQELPKAPEPQHAKVWWAIESGSLGAAYATDFTLTQRGVGTRDCPRCKPYYEANPLYGRYPSNARITIQVGAMYLGQSALLWKTEHSHRAWVRWAGRGWWAYQMVSEARAIHSWTSPKAHQ